MQYDKNGIPICTVKIGERVIVMGRPEKAIVENVHYSVTEMRWRITLDWGQHGMSRVWSTDEGKIWTKYSEAN